VSYNVKTIFYQGKKKLQYVTSGCDLYHLLVSHRFMLKIISTKPKQFINIIINNFSELEKELKKFVIKSIFNQ
tara:strand:+ start:140 stop:358 length:219 start_codon:yes stop_codon:yes gene_type:complete